MKNEGGLIFFLGHKIGLFIVIIIYYLVVNIQPPSHRFGLSLCLGLAKILGEKKRQ